MLYIDPGTQRVDVANYSGLQMYSVSSAPERRFVVRGPFRAAYDMKTEKSYDVGSISRSLTYPDLNLSRPRYGYESLEQGLVVCCNIVLHGL